MRSFSLLTQLLRLAEREYFTLKLELHFICFCYLIQSARTSFANQTQEFLSALIRTHNILAGILDENTLNSLFEDFVVVLKKSIQASFTNANATYRDFTTGKIR
jgi:hypothetical protein